MKRFRPFAWLLVGACFLMLLTGYTNPIVWQTSRDQAVEAARSSGKLIILFAGRQKCGNCKEMKKVFETPNVRQVIDANYICWYSDMDKSAEWYPYEAGLGTLYWIPIICVIDPKDPTHYLDRTTSTQLPSSFEARLRSHVPAWAQAHPVAAPAPAPQAGCAGPHRTN